MISLGSNISESSLGKSSKSEVSGLIGSKRDEESGSEELLSNEADDCSCWAPTEDIGLAVVSDVGVLEMSAATTAEEAVVVVGGTLVVEGL